jgi:NAD(P)-dependent dehydrogenase (short-subunit alcohol dehydrogenase family)
MPTLLVTGANRGLGLEFARQYAADGWRVLACTRAPAAASELQELAAGSAAGSAGLEVLALDVGDPDAIAALARRLSGTPVDVLLNNAGVFGPKPGADQDLRQQFGHLDPAVLEDLYRVNAIAPLRMAEAFVEHVAASGQKKIATISSSVGSIGQARSKGEGGLYAYRMSKAAVNMAMAALASDVAPRGISVGVYCPGWVRTAMGGPRAPLTPAESIAGLRARIAELDAARSGRFYLYDGTELPW